jgi:hypothetical protein
MHGRQKFGLSTHKFHVSVEVSQKLVTLDCRRALEFERRHLIIGT